MMTLYKNKVCVLIPAYNEESKIKEVINSIHKLGVTILVVDDGSIDETVNICKSIKNTLLLKHDKNYGYVESLNTGFKFLVEKDFDFIITIDADNQLSADDIDKFICFAVNENFDLVVGNRNYMNRVSEYFFSKLSMLILGLKDPFCGLKLYKMERIKEFLPFDSHNLIGSELLLKSKYNKLNIKQVPIISKKREGMSKFGNSIDGEFKILKASILILINHVVRNKF